MTNLGDFAQSRGDVMRRLHDLEQQVKRMRAERRLEAATIGRGGLRIKAGHLKVEENGDIIVTGGGGVTVSGGGGISVGDGGEVDISDGGSLRLVAADGTTIFHVLSNASNPDPDGNPQPSVFIYRNDGTTALSLDDPLPDVDGYNQILRMWDRTGNEIWAEDTTSGTGLATPWLSGTLYPSRYTDWPGTVSGTYETLWQGWITKTHPKLRVFLQHTSDATDTSGDVRVRVDGVTLGSAQAVGFVIAGSTIDAAVAGDVGALLNVEIQARRTAGTGQVRCSPFEVDARQT